MRIYMHYIPLNSHIYIDINIYELHFYIILLRNSEVGEFLRPEKQKNKTLQPHTAQEWFLIAVPVTDHHCRGMQKRKVER